MNSCINAALLVACLVAAEPKRLTTDGRVKNDIAPLDPSGAEFVYVEQDRPNRLRLMVLKFPEGTVAPLHPTEERSEIEPAVSADGKRIAFVQNRGNLSLTIVIRDRAASKDVDLPPGPGFSGYHSPTFTPAADRVFFAFAEQGKQGIWSIATTGGERKLVIPGVGLHNWPAVSPDGRTLLYGSSRDGNFEIYRSKLDGSEAKRLTNSPRADSRPRWSPDGKRIAFVSHRDGNAEIYVMNADGSAVKRVTHHPERDDFPCWHPDGKRLLIVRELDGKHDLWLVDVP